MKAVFRKGLRWLEPADEAGQTAIAALRHGDLVLVEIRRPRNIRQHRKWWALMGLIADNLDRGVTAETVCDVIKVGIGHVHTVQTRHGLVHIPKSISFAAINQTEFDAFYQHAIRYVVSAVLPGVNSTDLDREVMTMLGEQAP